MGRKENEFVKRRDPNPNPVQHEIIIKVGLSKCKLTLI